MIFVQSCSIPPPYSALSLLIGCVRTYIEFPYSLGKPRKCADISWTNYQRICTDSSIDIGTFYCVHQRICADFELNGHNKKLGDHMRICVDQNYSLWSVDY